MTEEYGLEESLNHTTGDQPADLTKYEPDSDAFSEKLVDELSMGDFFAKIQADYSDMLKELAERKKKLHSSPVSKQLSSETIRLPIDEYQAAKLFDMLMAPEDHFSVEDIAYLAKDDHPFKSVYGYWEAFTLKGGECDPAMAVPVMVDEDYLNLRREHEPLKSGKKGWK